MVVLIDPTVKHNLVEKNRVQKIFTDFSKKSSINKLKPICCQLNDQLNARFTHGPLLILLSVTFTVMNKTIHICVWSLFFCFVYLWYSGVKFDRIFINAIVIIMMNMIMCMVGVINLLTL